MQPIVINSYKIILDSYFNINFNRAKGSEKCNSSKKANYHRELAELQNGFRIRR